MKHSLCLHGVDFRHQGQFFDYVRQLIGPAKLKYRVKEKLLGDDMFKYRQAKLLLEQGPKIKINAIYGMMIASDKIYPLADIILEFDGCDAESVSCARMLVRRFLAGKQRFILDDPDLEQRIAQLRGHYYLENLDAYDKSTAVSALYCHLPWHVFAISKLWHDFLICRDKTVLRQLRVRVRRLRSVLSLLKPLTAKETAEQWKQLFKQKSDVLSPIREYDVALMICMRIRKFRKQEQYSCLESILLQKRTAAINQLVQQLQINKLTSELACFLLDVFSVKPSAEYVGMELNEFFVQRLSEWQRRILALPQKYSDFNDMEQLHKIRIKIKRFRYALQCVPEIKTTSSLIRSLKVLQDSLGLLHDDYINDCMVKRILAEMPENAMLTYEGAVFSGWEQGKADAAMESLGCQWEYFTQQLQQWADERL